MVGSNLDPRSRPGTILPGLNINPYDVWQKRVATEQEAGKLAAAKAKQDAENKKAALEAGKYEFKEVHRPHTAEYTQLGNEYINQEAQRMQKFAQTKNPDDDPNNYGSRAWTEREQGRLGLQQYAGYSNQQKSMAEKYQEKKFASPSLYTPEDDEWVSLVTTMSPLEAIEKGINLQDPNIIGHWDKDEALAPVKAILDSEAFGGATWDPELDIFTTTSGERVTPERVDQAAFAIAAPGTIGGFRWGNEIKKMSEEEQKRLAEGAARMSKKYNREITPEQFKASEDAKYIARSGSTTTKSKAGLYGTGSVDDRENSSWWADAVTGLGEGKSDIMRPIVIQPQKGLTPREQVAAAIEEAGLPKGINHDAVYKAWLKAGGPKEFEITGALGNFPLKKQKTTTADGKSYDINLVPTAIVAVVQPDGKKKYTYVVEPDLSKIENAGDKAEIQSKVVPEFIEVSQEEVVTSLWKGQATIGNKNLSPKAARARMEEKGWTYEETSGQWVPPGSAGGATTTSKNTTAAGGNVR